jgi:hypothetical protein
LTIPQKHAVCEKCSNVSKTFGQVLHCLQQLRPLRMENSINCTSKVRPAACPKYLLMSTNLPKLTYQVTDGRARKVSRNTSSSWICAPVSVIVMVAEALATLVLVPAARGCEGGCEEGMPLDDSPVDAEPSLLFIIVVVRCSITDWRKSGSVGLQCKPLLL